MAVDEKKIARNTAFLFFRMLLTISIGLFSVRIVLKSLGDEDYGIYNVVGGIVTMLAFINNALSSTTQRFLSFEIGTKNTTRLKNVFSTSLLLYGLLCVVIFCLAETIGLWFVNSHLNIPTGRMVAANWVYQLSIISFLFSIMQAPYNAAIIAHERMGIYAYVSIGEAVIKLTMIVALLYMSGDKLILYAIMMTATSMLVFIFYKVYCNRIFGESRFKFVLDRRLAKELFAFAGWSTWGALSNIFKGQGVNIVLNIFCGVIVNTARGIAFQLDNAISSLVQNFYVAAKPQIIKSYSSKEYNEICNLVHMTTRLGFYLMLIPSIIFLLDMDEILYIWLGYVPQYASIFTKLVLINNIVITISTPLMIVVHASGKVGKYQFFSGLSYMFVLPCVYFAVKYTHNPIYAFVIAIPFSIVYCYICYHYASKYVPMQPKWYCRLLLVMAVVALISPIAPITISYVMNEGLMRLVIETVVTIVSTGTVVFLLGLKRDERSSLLSIAQEYISRK